VVQDHNTAEVLNLLHTMLRQAYPAGGGRGGGGGPGGGGGGGGSGGGGGPPPGPPAMPLAPGQGQVPVAVAADVKSIGERPQIFDGDHTKADNFIKEVKAYFRVNEDMAGFNSPIKKVTFTLTLIKGDEVAGWVCDMGNWLDTLDRIHHNFPIVWTQFLDKFETQFQDLNKSQQGRMELKKCHMHWPNITQYISNFERYARQARYMQGNAETTDIFLKGLPSQVLTDVLKPPYAAGYEAMKRKAIDAIQALVLLDTIVASQGHSAPARDNHPQGGPPANFSTFARGNVLY
jgi:hypothetical protein